MILKKLQVYLRAVCVFFVLVVSNLILRLLLLISPNVVKKIQLKLGEKSTMTQNPNFKYEDWGTTFTSFGFIKAACLHVWMSLGQEAFEGSKAPDSPVVTMQRQKSTIFKYLNDNRPLVLSFGSCTCPPFLFKLEEFKQLVKDFRDVADFLVVYIAEAHSTDGWAFNNNIDINQHQSLEDRLSAAKILVKKDPLCPVVVDEMSNVTAMKYGAMPERLYVLQAGNVVYKGGHGPWGYQPSEVRSVLERMN